MDARQRKTRVALSGAILELAGDRPVGEISVSEVASLAGLHRSTFYEHAISPAELLAGVLRDELDEIRGRYLTDLGDADVAAAVRRVTDAVLVHIETHSAIYLRTIGDGNLRAMLSDHFYESSRLLMSRDSIRIPPIDGIEESLLRETAARYIADGTVGAVDIWLRTPMPRDRDAFVRMFAALVPAWWPGSGGNSAGA